MNKKVLLAAGIMAFAGVTAAQAGPGGTPFTGVNIGVGVQYAAFSAKNKQTTPKLTITSDVKSDAQQQAAAKQLARMDAKMDAWNEKFNNSIDLAGQVAPNADLSTEDEAAAASKSLIARNDDVAIQPIYNADNSKNVFAMDVVPAYVDAAITNRVVTPLQTSFDETLGKGNVTVTYDPKTVGEDKAIDGPGYVATMGTVTITYGDKQYTIIKGENQMVGNGKNSAKLEDNSANGVQIDTAVAMMFHGSERDVISKIYTAAGDSVTGGSMNHTEPYPVAVPAITTTSKANLSKGAVALSLGYGHQFGNFYAGVALNGTVFAAGNQTVTPTASTVATKQQNIGGYNVITTDEVVPVSTKIMYKPRWALGAEIDIGVSSGSWLFYGLVEPLVMSAKTTFSKLGDYDKATTASMRLSDTTVKDADGNSFSGPATATITDIALQTPATGTATADTGSYSKTKTRFGCAFGIGTKLALASNVSLGLSVKYMPTVATTINTPVVTNKSKADTSKYGTSNRMTVSAVVVALNMAYHF